MKTTLFALFALIAVAFTACEKEAPQPITVNVATTVHNTAPADSACLAKWLRSWSMKIENYNGSTGWQSPGGVSPFGNTGGEIEVLDNNTLYFHSPPQEPVLIYWSMTENCEKVGFNELITFDIEYMTDSEALLSAPYTYEGQPATTYIILKGI